jgi:hypothetical protein
MLMGHVRDSELIDALAPDDMDSKLLINESAHADLPNQPTHEKHLSPFHASFLALCKLAPQIASLSLSDSDPDGNHKESDLSDGQLSIGAVRQRGIAHDVMPLDDELKYLDLVPEIADSGTKRGKAISNNRLSLPPGIVDAALELDYATLPQLRYALLSCTIPHRPNPPSVIQR